jgi:hypothetical protein
MRDPGSLHRMTIVVGQPLDRSDFSADRARGGGGAGSYRPAIQVHGTNAALCDAASELRACQTDIVTQYPQQGCFGFGLNLVGLAIDS